jgi:hypothetical protein
MSNKKIYFNYNDKVYDSKYGIGIIVHTEKDNDNTCVVKFENCNKYYYEIKYSKLKKFKQKDNENK